MSYQYMNCELFRKKPCSFCEAIGKSTVTPPGSFPPPDEITGKPPRPSIIMSRSSVQGALRRAKKRAGITKRGVGIHTLRHSYVPHLLEAHRKVIEAILHCRTGEYGSTVYQCQSCGQMHTIHCSCGNRHCPQCQHHKTRQWLEKQLDRQLPGPHFLITFTVPEELHDFIRSHQKVCYDALFKASSEALKLLAKDKRFIGTDLPGFTGILHTWGRQLQYHPHIHYIVPGGGLSKSLP